MEYLHHIAVTFEVEARKSRCLQGEVPMTSGQGHISRTTSLGGFILSSLGQNKFQDTPTSK